MGKAQVLAVSLDLEGTLVDLEEWHFTSFTHAAKQFGCDISIATLLRHHPYVIGGGDAVVAEAIVELSGNKLEIDAILERKRHLFDESLHSDDIQPRPGVMAALTAIKKLGFPMAIGSLTDHKRAMVILERSGLLLFFEEKNIVLLEDVAAKKPDPEVYLTTAERMGISPEHQLVFEDSATGIEAARRASCPRIAMPALNFAPAEVRQHLCRNLIEAGATTIIPHWHWLNIDGLFNN